MKKLYLLSGMIFFGIAHINAGQRLTDKQRREIEKVQKAKIARQKELARPAVYKMIDPLVEAEINWPAVFAILDQMQGVIDVNEYQYQGETLLISAILTDNLLAAKTLLEKYKANPNLVVFQYPHTALMFACRREDVAMVKLLLSYKANPNFETKNGRTPFNMTSNPEIIEVLNQYKK